MVLFSRLKLCHWECYKRWHADSDEGKALLTIRGCLGRDLGVTFISHMVHGARNSRLPLMDPGPPCDMGCRLLAITNVSLTP